MADHEPWDAQTLQAVWFSPRAREVDAARIYLAMTGREPDTVQTNKAPQAANPFLGVAQGALEHADAVVQVQQTRVDFFLNASSREAVVLPLISDTDRHIDDFVTNFQNAADAVPDVIRCALVLNCLKPAPSLEEAASLVGWAISSPIDLRHATDLGFSANIQKTFANGDFRMNRVLRWSADTYQMLNVQVGMPSMAVAPTATTLEQFAATHYIDINMAPVRSPVDPKILAELIGEMGAEAKRVRAMQTLKALEN